MAKDSPAQKFEKVIGFFCSMSGTDSYEMAVAMLRAECQNSNTSPAPWLHNVARRLYLTAEPDSIDPKMLYEILGTIDTREKANAVFAHVVQQDPLEVEKFLEYLLKDFLPAIRSNSKLLAKSLPQHRKGPQGPSKMPSETQRRKICKELNKLEKQGVKRGIAQRRLVDRTGLSLRMIQRIWQGCEKKPG